MAPSVRALLLIVTVRANCEFGVWMTRKALLLCGIVASLVYVIADALGAVAWQDYSHASQGVSELMAIGAPSRPLVLSLMTVRSLLLIAFASGIWSSADGKLALRLTASLLVADAVVGQVTASFFPVPQRGAMGTATMHVIGTGVESLCIVLAMGFAAAAFGRRFRLYTIGTILILLVFGAWAGLDISRIEAQLPTPWLGITERINIYAYLLWMIVLAIALLHGGDTAIAIEARGRDPRGASGVGSLQ
jgi:hypothetical protein